MSKFRELRREKGLTQEELVKQFYDRYGKKYTASAISMFESGKRVPEARSLMDFADFFNVSVDYLLDGAPTPLANEPAGLRFKDLRIRRQLTQDELAVLFNARYGTQYTAGGISNIENGKRTPETKTLKNFASFFGVSLEYLMGGEEVQTPKRPLQLEKILAEQELTYNGEVLTQEDREKINHALELAFWDAKKLNKRKKG